MAELFNSKFFNGEVFGRYVDQVPDLKRNEFLGSGAVVERNDIAQMFVDQTGGHYAAIPISGRISGKPVKYDGNTDIETRSIGSYIQGRIVIGHADGFYENDYTYDTTGKTDFLEIVANGVAKHWDNVDQDDILATMQGIFSMTGSGNEEFVKMHTYDATTTAEATFGATTLNKALQKALGDNKAAFSLAIMHSAIATDLENLNILEYLKYTDARGIERPTGLATLNGRLVLIDDSMPFDEATETYTTYALGAGAIEYTNCGAKVPYEMHRLPKDKGGIDELISRQRKIFSPKGISWIDPTSTTCPDETELANGKHWGLAHNGESGAKKKVYPHKAIPIAQIKTKAYTEPVAG